MNTDSLFTREAWMNSFCSKSQNSELEFSEIFTFDFVFQFYGKVMFPHDWIEVMHFGQEYQRCDAVFSISYQEAHGINLSHYW